MIKRGSIAEGWLIPALAAAAAVTGCASTDAARGAGGPRSAAMSDCYRPNMGNNGTAVDFDRMSVADLQAIAQRCRTMASRLDSTLRDTTFANLWAGKALRAIGERRNLPAGANEWRDAAAALQLVTAHAIPVIRQNSTPVEKAFAEMRVEGGLELAQVYTRQARYDDAIRVAREVLQAYPSEYDTRHVRARYVLAQVYLRQEDEEGAMDSLRVFTQPALDAHPDAAAARKLVFETATKLGEASLAVATPDSYRRARAHFATAREAAEAANRRGGDLPVAATLINLGRVNMRIAGAAGPDVTGGCPRLPNETERLTAALDFFEQASSDPLASQYAGCAHLALGNLTEAVRYFRRGASSSSADAQLSLARALYRQAADASGPEAGASWSEASAAFEEALKLTPASDPAKKGRAHYEAGEFQAAHAALPGLLEPARRALVEKAIANLREAIRLLPSDAGAHLLLGKIFVGEGPFNGHRRTEGEGGARELLNTALRLSSQEVAQRAEAHYLLSRLEVNRFLAGQVPAADARRNRENAIRNADRAAELGDERRGRTFFAQACETRLIFKVSDPEGPRFCVADERRDADNLPLALLFEGMFSLRKAWAAANGREQSEAWEAAYVAFDRGVQRGDQMRGLGEWTELRAQLVTGRGIALGCSGLRRVGGEEISSVPSQLTDQARAFFDRYDLRVCAPPRR